MILSGIFRMGLFIILWVIVCYKDYKLQKINNYVILIGFALLLASFIFSSSRLSVGFAIAHFFLSISTALLLWYMNIWPSGDAKLFILLSLFLLSAFQDQEGLAPLRLCFSQMVNIFVLPAFCFLPFHLYQLWNGAGQSKSGSAIFFIFTHVNKAMWPSIRKKRIYDSLWDVACVIFMYGLVLLFYRMLLPRFGGGSILALLLVTPILGRLLKKAIGQEPYRALKAAVVGIVVTGMLYWRFRGNAPLLVVQDIGKILVLSYILRFLIMSLDHHMEEIEVLSIPREEIRPSLVIADSFRKKLGLDSSFSQHDFGRFYPDGLTGDQARVLKRWCFLKNIYEVEIYRTHPFAFWIFLGTFITLLTGRDVVGLLRLGL